MSASTAIADTPLQQAVSSLSRPTYCFKYASLPRGSKRLFRMASTRFRHEPSRIVRVIELCFVERRQRGRRNIEAQMHRRRDFIDVLSAGALRTHRMDVDLRIRDHHVRRDMQHRDLGPTSLPAAQPFELRAHSPKFESDHSSHGQAENARNGRSA